MTKFIDLNFHYMSASKTILLFLLASISYTQLNAQDSSLVTIHMGSRIKDVLTDKDIYLYPKFTRGIAYFRNGSKAGGLMNYSSLDDQMLFIDSKGDTLAIKDEKTLRYISVGTDTFYFDEGFVKLLASNGAVRVAEKKVWEVADIRKMGSHDRPAKTFAVTTVRTITDRFGRTLDLTLNEDVVLRKKPKYYLADTYSHFLIVNKKNLMSAFPKKQDVLSRYLKENKVNFNNKEDLEKLAAFIGKGY